MRSLVPKKKLSEEFWISKDIMDPQDLWDLISLVETGDPKEQTLIKKLKSVTPLYIGGSQASTDSVLRCF